MLAMTLSDMPRFSSRRRAPFKALSVNPAARPGAQHRNVLRPAALAWPAVHPHQRLAFMDMLAGRDVFDVLDKTLEPEGNDRDAALVELDGAGRAPPARSNTRRSGNLFGSFTRPRFFLAKKAWGGPRPG